MWTLVILYLPEEFDPIFILEFGRTNFEYVEKHFYELTPRGLCGVFFVHISNLCFLLQLENNFAEYALMKCAFLLQ